MILAREHFPQTLRLRTGTTIKCAFFDGTAQGGRTKVGPKLGSERRNPHEYWGLRIMIKVCKPFVRGSISKLEHYGVMSTGSHGVYGNGGILFSVSCRFYRTNMGSNPTLSASSQRKSLVLVLYKTK